MTNCKPNLGVRLVHYFSHTASGYYGYQREFSNLYLSLISQMQDMNWADRQLFNRALSSFYQSIVRGFFNSAEWNALIQVPTMLLLSLQEMKESHASSMEEKESLIQKLRATLANKDKSLQDSIRQSPSANNTLIQQMQAQLRDKDSLLEVSALPTFDLTLKICPDPINQFELLENLLCVQSTMQKITWSSLLIIPIGSPLSFFSILQELMAERARTAESHDSTMKELLNKLSQKDDHFKVSLSCCTPSASKKLIHRCISGNARECQTG